MRLNEDSRESELRTESNMASSQLRDYATTSPDVSVIVPVYNAMPHLPHCVEALFVALRHMDEESELIFVDNGSTDGSREFLEEQCCDRAMIVSLPIGNVGAVRNRGIRHASGTYLSFVDADCVVAEDYFSHAISVLKRTGCSVTGSAYDLPDDPSWVERTWTKLHKSPREKFVKYVPAGNLFCHRAVFDEVGMFDPRLKSGEDTEWAMRLRECRLKIYESPAVRAVHLGNPKTMGDHLRKQRWHGKGAFGTAMIHCVDKPLLMTFAHVLCLAAGLLLVIGSMIGSPSLTRLALGLTACIAVPATSVIYRMCQVRRMVSPLQALALYWVYFIGRAIALVELGITRIRRGAVEPSIRSSQVGL